MLTSPVQCKGCRHLQRRGGIVLPAELLCTAAEGSQNGELLGKMLQVFAADGRCPSHDALLATHPDCYLSEDLEVVS